MPYQTELDKTQMTPFAELYQIIAGGTTYYYTSYVEDVTFQSNNYLKRPISRGEFSYAEGLRALKVRLSAPLDTPYVNYLANFPPDLTQVKITRLFVGTADFVQLFDGYIIAITIENRVVHAECESETRLLRNKVPKYLFQAWCNHMLFDTGCGLLESNFAVNAVVQAFEGTSTRLISSTFGNYAADHFTLGHAKFGNDVRLIEAHYISGGPTADHIKIHFPFPNLQVGNTITVYPGCDKSHPTCLNKFNNVARRLAFDNIPSSNPVVWGFK